MATKYDEQDGQIQTTVLFTMLAWKRGLNKARHLLLVVISPLTDEVHIVVMTNQTAHYSTISPKLGALLWPDN
jgi:hypothetical protein